MATSFRRDTSRCFGSRFVQHRAVCELMKGFAQFLQGTVDASSYGVEFAPEKAGNFLVLQFLKAAEKQDFSLSLRQLLERALQQLDFLLLLGGIRWNNWRQHFRLERGLARELPKVVHPRFAPNLANPPPPHRSEPRPLPVSYHTTQ